MSGEKDNNLNTIDYSREVLAWDNGFKEIKKYKDLLKHKDNYKNYRNFCLKTYRDNLINK
jgi:hypothetical protein